MSRDHRLVLGNVGDIADGRATERIVEALDYEYDRRARAARIAAALRRLNAADRAFAQAVLKHGTWEDMGIPKASYYRTLKKVEALLSNVG